MLASPLAALSKLLFRTASPSSVASRDGLYMGDRPYRWRLRDMPGPATCHICENAIVVRQTSE